MRRFALRLALKSGFWVVNPDLMLSLMPQRVFREWLAFSEVEPWDEERADIRSAMIAHTMYSLWRGKGPRRQLSDFMPKFKRDESRRQTPKDGLRAMVHLASVLNMTRKEGVNLVDNRPEKRKKRDGPLW